MNLAKDNRIMSKKRAVGNGRKSISPSAEVEERGAGTAKALQMEILNAYAQLSRSWLARVQSEAAMWADLGARVATSRSLAEILDAQKQCVSHQIKMTVEDGQHLFDDCEMITRQICDLVRTGAGSTDTAQRGDS